MEGNTGFNGNDEFGRMNGENGMPEANVNDFSNTANFSSYNYGFSNSNDNYSASSNAFNNFDYGYTGENAAYNAENIAGEAANFANEVNNTAESFGGSFSEPAGSASFGNYGFDNNAAMNNGAFGQSPVQNTYEQNMYQNQNTFGQDPVQNTFGQDMYQNQAQSTFGQDPVQNTYEQNMYQDSVQNTFGQSAGTESFGVNEEPTYSQNTTESFGSTNDSFSYGGGVDLSGVEQPKKSSGMGIASLVLGILSIVCCCTGCFGSLLGILAIIFGIIHLGKKKGAKGLGIAGIITGALGLIIGIIMTIYAVTSDGLTTILDDGDDYDYGYDYDDDDDDYDYDYDYNYGDDDDDDDYDFSFSSLDYYYNTYGQWLLKSGSGNACYTFNFDNSWGWYKDYNDLTDNYYAGKSFEILTGDEAFELCNIDDSERAEMDEDRFLGYKLYVDKYISNGEDKSSQYNGEKYFAIGIYMDDDLQGGKLINVNADEEYEVSKNYDYIDNSYSWDSEDDDSDDSDDIEYKTVELYDGYAQIDVPDTWIEYGEQVTDAGTNYYAYGSSSGLFEMYVTIQDAGDSWSSADDMFNFCDEDLRNLFGSENIMNVVTDANANPALYYCEAYNDENNLHYYCTYNYFDGKNFTMVEFYCDEDTVNADKDYYASYMQEIAESLWIWG